MIDHRIKQLLLLLSAGLIIINGAKLTADAYSMSQQPAMALEEPGYEYADLKPFIANKKRIGYIKDWNIQHQTVHRLLTAQFQLAPVVLDPDETSHALWLIDSSTPESLTPLLTATHGRPVVTNKYQKMIALKP